MWRSEDNLSRRIRFYFPLAQDRVSLVSVSVLRILVWLGPEMISPVSDFVLAIGVLELELYTVHLAFYMGSGVRLRLLGFHVKCFYSLSCFHNLYLLFFILFLLLLLIPPVFVYMFLFFSVIIQRTVLLVLSFHHVDSTYYI